MPFWLFFITSPFMLPVLFLVFEIYLNVKVSNINRIPPIARFRWRLLIYVALMLISTAVYWRLLFTKDYHPSPVDPTPIAQLTDEQIGNLRNAVEEFRDFDFIQHFAEQEFENHPSSISESIGFTWRCTNTSYSLNIWLRFYISRNRNVENFHWILDRHYTQAERFTHISNPNDTELILYDTFMDRAGHMWPTNTRLIRTQIRMGNVRITLSESPHVRHLDRNLSNEFINLLVELLTDSPDYLDR